MASNPWKLTLWKINCFVQHFVIGSCKFLPVKCHVVWRYQYNEYYNIRQYRWHLCVLSLAVVHIIPKIAWLLTKSLQAVLTERCVPWHERSSVSSLNPFLQLHSKLPMVFLQKCSQPPLWSSHSSISVGGQVRISLQHFSRTSCTNQLP